MLFRSGLCTHARPFQIDLDDAVGVHIDAAGQPAERIHVDLFLEPETLVRDQRDSHSGSVHVLATLRGLGIKAVEMT